MKALVLHGPWDIAVEDRPDPQPGPDEVLIQVIATGICGSDIHGYTGENGRRHPGQVMGHETVGRVVDAGSAADVAPGALVTVNPVIACGTCPACRAGAEQRCANRKVIGVAPEVESAFAERMLAPRRNVVELPGDMPVEYGALVEPLAVGYHAARRGGCVPDDLVLVIGGGPIGQACVLALQRLGATRVVVSEPNPGRRHLVEALGAATLDPAAAQLPDAVAAVLGGPATLVLDAVGTSRTVADALAASGFGARIVLVGMNSPRLELAAYAVSTEERSVVGSFSYSAADFTETARWVGTAPPVLAHLVDGRTDLAGAPQAFADLGKGVSSASKVLVFPAGIGERVGDRR